MNQSKTQKSNQLEGLKFKTDQLKYSKLFCMIQNDLHNLNSKDKKQKSYKKNTSIAQIEAVLFMRLTRKKEQKLFSVSI